MLRYRLILEPDDNGTILVTSPDIPVVSYGGDVPTALHNTEDAIHVLLTSMMDAREDIPIPDVPPGSPPVILNVPVQTELKVRLYLAMRGAGLSRADLQRRLGWQRESIDRLFRLGHNSRMEQIELAFKALGKVVRVDVQDAPPDEKVAA